MKKYIWEAPYQPRPKPPKPKTKADRIRAMSDEELAERLIFFNDDWQGYETDAGDYFDREKAIKAELAWLQQPAEGD